MATNFKLSKGDGNNEHEVHLPLSEEEGMAGNDPAPSGGEQIRVRSTATTLTTDGSKTNDLSPDKPLRLNNTDSDRKSERSSYNITTSEQTDIHDQRSIPPTGTITQSEDLHFGGPRLRSSIMRYPPTTSGGNRSLDDIQNEYSTARQKLSSNRITYDALVDTLESRAKVKTPQGALAHSLLKVGQKDFKQIHAMVKCLLTINNANNCKTGKCKSIKKPCKHFENPTLVGGAQLCIIDAAHHLLPKDAVSERGILHSSDQTHQTASPFQHQGVEGETPQALSPNIIQGNKLISTAKLTSKEPHSVARHGYNRAELRHPVESNFYVESDEEICVEPLPNNLPQLTRQATELYIPDTDTGAYYQTDTEDSAATTPETTRKRYGRSKSTHRSGSRSGQSTEDELEALKKQFQEFRREMESGSERATRSDHIRQNQSSQLPPIIRTSNEPTSLPGQLRASYPSAPSTRVMTAQGQGRKTDQYANTNKGRDNLPADEQYKPLAEVSRHDNHAQPPVQPDPLGRSNRRDKSPYVPPLLHGEGSIRPRDPVYQDRYSRDPINNNRVQGYTQVYNREIKTSDPGQGPEMDPGYGRADNANLPRRSSRNSSRVRPDRGVGNAQQGDLRGNGGYASDHRIPRRAGTVNSRNNNHAADHPPARGARYNQPTRRERRYYDSSRSEYSSDEAVPPNTAYRRPDYHNPGREPSNFNSNLEPGKSHPSLSREELKKSIKAVTYQLPAFLEEKDEIDKHIALIKNRCNLQDLNEADLERVMCQCLQLSLSKDANYRMQSFPDFFTSRDSVDMQRMLTECFGTKYTESNLCRKLNILRQDKDEPVNLYYNRCGTVANDLYLKRKERREGTGHFTPEARADLEKEKQNAHAKAFSDGLVKKIRTELRRRYPNQSHYENHLFLRRKACEVEQFFQDSVTTDEEEMDEQFINYQNSIRAKIFHKGNRESFGKGSHVKKSYDSNTKEFPAKPQENLPRNHKNNNYGNKSRGGSFGKKHAIPDNSSNSPDDSGILCFNTPHHGNYPKKHPCGDKKCAAFNAWITQGLALMNNPRKQNQENPGEKKQGEPKTVPKAESKEQKS